MQRSSFTSELSHHYRVRTYIPATCPDRPCLDSPLRPEQRLMANFLETLRVTFQPTSSLIWSIRLFAHILFLAPHLPCLSLSCLCLSLSCLCLVSVCVTFQPTSSLIWSVRLFAHILFLAPHIPCLCFVSVSVLSLSVSVLFLSLLPSSPHPLSFGQYGSSPTYCSWLCTFSVLSLYVSVCLSLVSVCLCLFSISVLSLSVSVLFLSVLSSSLHPLSFGQ